MSDASGIDMEKVRSNAIITEKMLVKNYACDEQVKLFRRVFPNGAQVNYDNALKATEELLDLRWLIYRVLKGDRIGRARARFLEYGFEYDGRINRIYERYEYGKRYERYKGTGLIRLMYWLENRWLLPMSVIKYFLRREKRKLIKKIAPDLAREFIKLCVDIGICWIE